MTALRDLDRDAVVAAATTALSDAWGEPVRIGDVAMLSDAERRNLILRGRAVRDGRQPRSVIVKATRAAGYDPAAENGFAEFGLVKEWAATAFLAAHTASRRTSATLLAGNARRGILVFEDLGADLGSLVEPLRGGNGDEAERALTAYATTLGRLHAAAAGCREAHARALRAAFPAAHPPAPRHGERLARIVAKLDERIGGQPPAYDVAQVAHRLQEPGAWLSLVHGDPCPDNALIVKDGVRLVDFEFAAPGHALLDAVYWRIGFPTCWCAGRVPDPVAMRAEAAYRAQLRHAIRDAQDDAVFRTEIAYVAAAWLLGSLDWRLDDALAEDRVWGLASVRSRLLWYIEATIAMTEQADILPGLRAVSRRWLDVLRERWPSSEPLGYYPAFASSADAPLSPEHREPQHQQHEEDHHEKIEQDAGNVG
jgi:hypothetical protein